MGAALVVCRQDNFSPGEGSAGAVFSAQKRLLNQNCQNCRSPRARLCPAGRGRGRSRWTETPRGGGGCHCCTLGAGRPEVE